MFLGRTRLSPETKSAFDCPLKDNAVPICSLDPGPASTRQLDVPPAAGATPAPPAAETASPRLGAPVSSPSPMALRYHHPLVQQDLEVVYTDLNIAAARDQVVRRVVGGLVVNSEDKVLIVRRASGEDFLPGLEELPGGHIEGNESIAEAVIRELHEETGLHVTEIQSYVGGFDYESKSGKLTRQWNFRVSVDGLEVKLNPEEHDDWCWVGPEDLASHKVSEAVQECILSYFQVQQR